MASRIAGVASHVTGMASRVTGVASHVAGMASRIAGVASRVMGMACFVVSMASGDTGMYMNPRLPTPLPENVPDLAQANASTNFQILWRALTPATDSNWSNCEIAPFLVVHPAAGSSESFRISLHLRDFLKGAVIAFGMSDRPDKHTDVNAKRAEQVRKDQEASMLATRESLPATRDSITHKFCIDRYEGYLMIGLYADGRPGEIFIKMAKEGSTISGLCQAFCRAFSLAIQHGLSINEAVARFKDMRFEPMGSTSNPEIPEAASIVDYVARYLELHFSEPVRGTIRR